MKKAVDIISRFGFCILIVTLLSGCSPLSDLFKQKGTEKKAEVEEIKEEIIEEGSKDISEKDDQSKGIVLLNIDGKPIVNEETFNRHLNQMLQMNPYLRGAKIDSLPMAIKRKFFDELVKQELALAWAEKNNLADDVEFKKAFDEMKKLVRRSLLIQQFESQLFKDVKVSEKEIENYYEKEKVKFIKEPGGVLISAIKFKNDEGATSFYDKVKDKKSDFIALAEKETSGEFKDFGRISKDQKDMTSSEIPSSIKNRAFVITNLPVIEKIPSGKSIWVVYFSDKKDHEYFQLNEIKAQIEGMLRNNKLRDALEKRIEELKKEFSINVNEGYFKETKPALPEGVRIKTKEEKEAEEKLEKEAAEKKEEKLETHPAATHA